MDMKQTENKMLRIIFDLKRKKQDAGEYYTKWAEHVAHMRMRNAYKILVENLKGSDHLGDTRMHEITILKRIFEK
jgi:hypothetical protein